LLQSIYVFISGSAVHSKFLEMQQDLDAHARAIRLKPQCETRWACRALSIEAVFCTFSAIVQTLKLAANDRSVSRTSL
jgi:hypothetical protein